MGSRKNYNQRKGAAGKSDITLIMESGTQPLSEIQLSVKNKIEEEYIQFKKKLTESMNKKNGEIIEQGTHITVYEIDCTPNFPTPVIQKDLTTTSNAGLIKATPTSTLLATSQPNGPPLISNNSVLLPSASVSSSGSTVFTGQPTTYQLVMGPRMGLIVTPSSPASVSTIASPTNVSPTPTITTVRSAGSRVQVRPGLTNVSQPTAKRLPSPSVSTPGQKISVNPATQKNNAVLTKGPVAGTTSTVNTRSKGKLNTRQSEPSPAESSHPTNAFNKSSSNTNAFVDLTDDDGKPAADSREVSFNKYPGKIFPSLVVVARPHLKTKEMSSAMITAERTQLDTKVKGILTNSPTKFTEWLIQQGLVRSEQVCNLHVNIDMTPIKLKLGMYSDVSKFPYSGGYVWISDCCPQKFVSVFCNSVFEGAPHAPTILLKLMYHWACQTNVHNIISWVKVENLYIKNFFTNLRAVCSAAVCEKFGKMGGAGKKIEVGVISLGTTSQNGSVRQVKVEVLGIMDPVTKFVRLRAVDPVQNAEKNHKLRFSRILESLEQWVHKSTTIITDYTVDKSTLNDLGFHSVLQVQLNSSHSKENNQAIMDYLKRVVPRMFQNTLSLLSRSIIQQFLDELVWRERWGFIPSRAFENLIQHLSEMTKLDTGETLINRLKSITANPFKDWSYKNWKTNCMKKSALTSEDADTTNKPASAGAQKGLRSKSVTGSTNAIKSSVQGTSKAAAKTSSTITLTIDDSSDEITGVPSIDNLPPSITDIDDDNVSVSSNSSRRSSRNRSAISEDGKISSNGVGRAWTDSVPVLKSLETFYYGVLPPDVVVVTKLKQVDLNMKCFVCGLTYNNNILFMKHLAGHAQNEGAFTTDFQCRYCLKNFTTAYDLEDHLGSTHFPNKYNSMCLICGERFKFRAALITHMQNTHVELELPYNCTICKYRTSEHTKAVDHFYEVHDGGERVQCPFCLKVVALESSTKTKLTQNVNFFFNHIKRHQQKRKCPKCVLSFVNKALLKEHLMKDHNSCIALPGIIRHQFLDMATVLMPLPSSTPTFNRKGKPLPLSFPSFSTYKIENQIYYPDIPPAKCLECKTEVSVNQHFTSYLTCMKCMFASCCKTVMVKHIEKFHEGKGRRRQPQRKTIPLQKPLYCVCGFSNSCGNNMASHLVHCKRRIAYPNPERAAQYSVQMQSASFPPLVNLDDVEQDPNDASNKWLRAFAKNSATSETDDSKSKRMAISEKSPPRMLKELGLVRTETSLTDDDNVAVKAPDLDDDSPTTIKPAPMETDDDQQENLSTNYIKKPEIEDLDKSVEVSSSNANDSSSEAECEVEEPELEDSTSSDKNNEANSFEDTASSAKEPNDMTAISDTDDTNLEPATKPRSPKKDDTISISDTEGSVTTSEKECITSTSCKDDVVPNDTEAVDEVTSLVEKGETVNTAATEDRAEVISEREQTVTVRENKEDDGIDRTRDETHEIVEAASREKEEMEQLETELVTTTEKKSIESTVEITKNVKSAVAEVTEKICDESAEMETEEQSPMNERMDDMEENPVAMDCEENVDEPNKMVVDTDSVQDAMVVD